MSSKGDLSEKDGQLKQRKWQKEEEIRRNVDETAPQGERTLRQLMHMQAQVMAPQKKLLERDIEERKAARGLERERKPVVDIYEFTQMDSRCRCLNCFDIIYLKVGLRF